jgi:hypothetical protein
VKVFRIAVVMLLTGGVTLPCAAGDLRESGAKAVEQAVAAQAGTQERSSSSGIPALKWTGRGLFIGGMAVGLYGFINDKNGKFAEFGEAKSSNKHLGAAGLSTAFAGGVLMLAGTHHRGMPSITAAPGNVSISKNVTW